MNTTVTFISDLYLLGVYDENAGMLKKDIQSVAVGHNKRRIMNKTPVFIMGKSRITPGEL